jgi:hypothetical protein
MAAACRDAVECRAKAGGAQRRTASRACRVCCESCRETALAARRSSEGPQEIRSATHGAEPWCCAAATLRGSVGRRQSRMFACRGRGPPDVAGGCGDLASSGADAAWATCDAAPGHAAAASAFPARRSAAQEACAAAGCSWSCGRAGRQTDRQTNKQEPARRRGVWIRQQVTAGDAAARGGRGVVLLRRSASTAPLLQCRP